MKFNFSKKQKSKANKKAKRDIDLEFGLTSGQFHKIHNSEKQYNRKIKHKKLTKFNDE